MSFPRRGAGLSLVIATALCWPLPGAGQAQQDSPNDSVTADKEEMPSAAADAKKKIILPGGTPVYLRFAKAVISYPPERAVKTGDEVALVVAREVRVDGKVVIAKGATARASIAWVQSRLGRLVDRTADVLDGLLNNSPNSDAPVFPIRFRMQLEWAASANRVPIPVAPISGKRSKTFFVRLASVGGGVVALPWAYSWTGKQSARAQELCDKPMLPPVLIGGDPNDDPRRYQQFQIPVGARLTAFVDGDVPLDAAEIEQAQIAFPAQNEAALLTLYRGPDVERKCGEERPGDNKFGPSPDLNCDQEHLGHLEAKQYRTLELAPGKHSCRVNGSAPLELSLVAGDESFIRLYKKKKKKPWQLELVDPVEGEDDIAAYARR